MSNNFTIKLKALLLLILFASNTAVGFACALDLNMGFNSPHLSEVEEAVEVHVHDDGKKHVHEIENKKHHNNEYSKQVSEADSHFFSSSLGGCCTDGVQKFQNLDKNITSNVGTNIPVFVATISIYFGINFSKGIKMLPNKFNARTFYPPPPDILIAIQRFQI